MPQKPVAYSVTGFFLWYSLPMSVRITAGYTFVSIDASRLPAAREELLAFGKARDMRGLVLLAEEGINGTVCGSQEAIAQWKEHLQAQFGAIVFKDSEAPKAVFRRWSVKIKPEIVGLKRQDIRPAGEHRHLTPAQWHDMLQREDVVVLDTRNDYEVQLGTFRGAVNPNIKRFSDLPHAVTSAGIPKDKPVMMFCTGGIRCEKAVLALEEEGYRDVYQLEGGILAYLEQFPNAAFEGECFVFDQRTSVDQQLQPSVQYAICHGCGLPARQDEVHEACAAKGKRPQFEGCAC